ncbi:uncharacterized protein LOC117103520 isoform X2 [Anneissia japonica]|uniref:uncharacterized protein LOC117103520 isoform X2 n=1 Tax=Anneissia japonica TaxID=1529436 RepID=UPI001425A39E|nr:uncharacterized protein LOC117103520 isoform X2 [Anneissia japonica]
MYQTILQRFIWMIVLVSVVCSAPARDLSASKTSVKNLQTVKGINESKPPITRPPSDVNTEKPSLTLADSSEDNEKSEGTSDNKEIVDYQMMQKDSNSKVVNDKQVGNEVPGHRAPALSDEEADQLMMLMSDPVAIAEYLAVSGDIVGFLEVLDALQTNGFIDGKVAEQLKNEVSNELDSLLIEENAEKNEVYPMQQQTQNEEYMETEMLNIIKQIMTLPVLTPGEVYQAMIYEGASGLVASVAGLVYQRIIEREITPEAGVSLVAAVFQLSLPNQYIPEETSDESFYDDAFLDYILETMSEDDNMINDDIEGESQQDGKIEDLPIMNSAGKQIGEEHKVHSSKPLLNKDGKVIGKAIEDDVRIETAEGGSLEEELQDMAVDEGQQETNDKSSLETESAEVFGSGESELEYLLDDKDMEKLPDILKMRLKNYFKAVDGANGKQPE